MKTVQIGRWTVARQGDQTKPYREECGWPDHLPWCMQSNRLSIEIAAAGVKVLEGRGWRFRTCWGRVHANRAGQPGAPLKFASWRAAVDALLELEKQA